MSYFEVIIRVIYSFFVLLILTRLMGKKEISQLNVFTFITAITIGNIAASITTDRDLKILNGILGLIGWALLTILMSYFSVKSKVARKLIVGEPLILIRDGKIMENTLNKVHLDTTTLEGMLRSKDIFSLKEVEFAIFEIDGSLSVMKKQDSQKGKKGKMWKKTMLFPTSTCVISDGEINEDALSNLNLDRKWLKEQLKKAGFNSPEPIFYAELQPDGSLYFDYRDDKIYEKK